MSNVSGVSIQAEYGYSGLKGIAAGNAGMATQTKLPASITAEASKIFKGGDNNIPVTFTKSDGTTGQVFVSKDTLASLKKIAADNIKAAGSENQRSPITIMKGTTSLGTVDPKSILDK